MMLFAGLLAMMFVIWTVLETLFGDNK